MSLIYKGNGEFILGVPAQNLDDETISRLAVDFNLSEKQLISDLCARGLYEQEKPKAKTTKKDDPIVEDE